MKVKYIMAEYIEIIFVRKRIYKSHPSTLILNAVDTSSQSRPVK